MPTKPLSLQLKADTFEKLAALAAQRDQSMLHVAEQFIDEALRMEDHPGIIFRDGPTGRRAALHHGPDVWEIMPVIRNEGGGDKGIQGAAEYLGLPVTDIRAAARYYEEYRDEIDERIRRNEELAERAEADWLREQGLRAG